MQSEVKHRKKVLFITYYFPPSGGAAVQRTLKFLKRVSLYGWEPIVLTVRNPDYPVIDTSLLAEIPEATKVYKTFIPEPSRLYKKLSRGGDSVPIDLSLSAARDDSKTGLVAKLATFFRSWLFIPDARIGWLPFALVKGIRIILREDIDLIFSSAPPNTVHLIGALLKWITRRKWVADFRDPWMRYIGPQRRFRIPQKIDAGLCKWTVKSADYLIWVCNGVKQEIGKVYDNELPAKEMVITNGFNAEDFTGLRPMHSKAFTICYLGSFYVNYDLTAFINAVNALCTEDRAFKNDLKIVFCGVVDQEVEAQLANSSFGDRVEYLGYKKHKEALEIMASSDLLLLYIIDSQRGKYIPTSKLYEYIGARKPILALAPEDSDAAEIINHTRAGVIVPPAEKDEIRAAIMTLYVKWRNGTLSASESSEEAVQTYELTHLSEKLVNVWNTVVDVSTDCRAV